jgi:hypothetical protein
VASRFRVIAAVLLAAGLTGGAIAAWAISRSPEPAPAAQPLATTLASIDTTKITVSREAFCDAVPAGDAQAAVDDSSAKKSAWSNGDPLGNRRDVAHEYGCSWTAGSGAVAAGWVFAPPVTAERAAELVASAQSGRGCTPLAGAAQFGSPSVALACTRRGTTTLSYRGLFGDAWLVCELTGSAAADPTDVAGRWCASVLTAVTEAD